MRRQASSAELHKPDFLLTVDFGIWGEGWRRRENRRREIVVKRAQTTQDRCIRRLNIYCFGSESGSNLRLSPPHELTRGWCGMLQETAGGREV